MEKKSVEFALKKFHWSLKAFIKDFPNRCLNLKKLNCNWCLVDAILNYSAIIRITITYMRLRSQIKQLIDLHYVLSLKKEIFFNYRKRWQLRVSSENISSEKILPKHCCQTIVCYNFGHWRFSSDDIKPK